MGCASSSDADCGQGKTLKSVHDVSGQQLSTLPAPQSAGAIKAIVARDNLLSRLPNFESSKVWVGVERFDMSKNRFTRIPPQLEALPKLTSIDFSSNPFAKSGAFDSLLKLPRVTQVHLRDVGIKLVPVALVSCRTIAHLDLSSNPSLVLSGKGAPSLEKMVHLRSLSLRNCELAGELPSALRNLKLTSLDLSGNPKLDLSEPKSWGLLKKTLHELTVEELALFCLPRGLCSCTAVRKLSLKGNPTLESLSGLIFMTELTELDLSECHLKTLPTELDTAERLQHLNLSGNRFMADPTVPANWWRWPVNVSAVQISVLACLNAVDLRPAAAESTPDAQVVGCLSGCKDLLEVSLCRGEARNALPMALATNLTRLASYNELPVPESDGPGARMAKMSSVSPAPDHLHVLPTAFTTVQPGGAVANFVDWLKAIHAARTPLGLMWPVAVERFRVFDTAEPLRATSPRRRGDTVAALGVGDVPLDVAAVHIGLLLQALLEPSVAVGGAPYCCTMRPPASASAAKTGVWDTLVAPHLPSGLAMHDLLGSRNPLDDTIEAPEISVVEDHARELILRFAAHVVDAVDMGMAVDQAEVQYVRLLGLTVTSSRYLPLTSQIAALAHCCMDPALFACDVGPLFPAKGGVDIPQVIVQSGSFFETSDAALGRTSAAWDAEYKEQCPWIGGVAKGWVAFPELLI